MSGGYCGLMVPAQLWWQGYFVPDQMARMGRQLIKQARAEMEKPGWPGHKVFREIDGVKSPDQKIVGALCGAMVEGALQRRDEVVGAAAAGVRLLTQRDFFLVRATLEPHGTMTTIHYLDVDSIEAAREAIKTDPRIMAIEVERLLKPKDEPVLRSAALTEWFGTGKTRTTPRKPEGQT